MITFVFLVLLKEFSMTNTKRSIKLIIKGVSNVPERIYKWTLE